MRFFIILFFTLSFCFSQDEKYQLSTVAFYNVENLFDTVDDPNNGWDESMSQRVKISGQKKNIEQKSTIYQKLSQELEKKPQMLILLS